MESRPDPGRPAPGARRAPATFAAVAALTLLVSALLPDSTQLTLRIEP